MSPTRRAVLVCCSVVLVASAAGLLPGLPATQSDPPRWWKGNLHTHTLWSDGQAFPETVVSWYKRNGYHFLALSDHNVLQEGERWVRVGGNPRLKWAYEAYVDEFGPEWLEQRRVDGVLQVRLKTLDEFRTRFEEPDRFLLIVGEEITDSCQGKPVHLNGSNIRELVKPRHGATVAETIRNNVAAVIEQEQRFRRPMLVHLNHPNYGWAVTVDDLVNVPEERFFEVYNGHPAVRNEGDSAHPSTEDMWDQVLVRRLLRNPEDLLFGVATDDAHVYDREDGSVPAPGRGWVCVRAPHLTPWDIVRAMKNGDFYASTGVILDDVVVTNDSYSVVVRAQEGVDYTIEFIGARLDGEVGNVPEAQVLARFEGTSATYEFQGDELYVRCRVTSSRAPQRPLSERDRERAWTQPVAMVESLPQGKE